MKNINIVIAIIFVCLSSVVLATEPNTIILNDKYPDLALGCLSYARLAELPAGVLLKSADVTVKTSEVDEQIAKNPKEIQEQLKKNELFLVEKIATGKILVVMARKDAANNKTDLANKTDNDVINAYFENVLKSVTVTDEEVKQFYQENKDACGGASLDSMKDQIKQYVLGQKQQSVVAEYIKTLGKKISIEISSSWVSAQVPLVRDNPVDKARQSGKPSVVDFGSTGCRPCDMMTPVLANLKEKYAGKANVLFVHIKEQPVLAERFGIQSIPIQVFFNKDGKEVFRHTGFYPQTEIEQKLAEIGI